MKDIVKNVLEHPIATVIVVGSVGGVISKIISVVPKVAIIVGKKDEP